MFGGDTVNTQSAAPHELSRCTSSFSPPAGGNNRTHIWLPPTTRCHENKKWKTKAASIHELFEQVGGRNTKTVPWLWELQKLSQLCHLSDVNKHCLLWVFFFLVFDAYLPFPRLRSDLLAASWDQRYGGRTFSDPSWSYRIWMSAKVFLPLCAAAETNHPALKTTHQLEPSNPFRPNIPFEVKRHCVEIKCPPVQHKYWSIF